MRLYSEPSLIEIRPLILVGAEMEGWACVEVISFRGRGRQLLTSCVACLKNLWEKPTYKNFLSMIFFKQFTFLAAKKTPLLAAEKLKR